MPTFTKSFGDQIKAEASHALAIKNDTGLRSISLLKRLVVEGEDVMRVKTEVGCAVFNNQTDKAGFWKSGI